MVGRQRPQVRTLPQERSQGSLRLQVPGDGAQIRLPEGDGIEEPHGLASPRQHQRGHPQGQVADAPLQRIALSGIPGPEEQNGLPRRERQRQLGQPNSQQVALGGDNL